MAETEIVKESPKKKDFLGIDNLDFGLDSINQPIDLGMDNIDFGI